LDNAPIAGEERQQTSRRAPAIERIVAYAVPIEGTNDAVYGLLLIGTLLAAEGGQHDTFTDTVTATIVASLLAWFAHAYATLLGQRLTSGDRLSLAGLRTALGRDLILLRGGAIPLVVLIACWLAGISEATAVTAAIFSVIGAIFLLEIVAAILSHATRAEFAIDASVGLLLGLSVFLLKVLLH